MCRIRESARMRGLGQALVGRESGKRELDAQPQHVGPKAHPGFLDEKMAKPVGRKEYGISDIGQQNRFTDTLAH